MVLLLPLALSHYLLIVMQIGQGILWIVGPLLGLLSFLGIVLLLGLPRNKLLYLDLPLMQSIELWPLPLLNFVGFVCFFEIWVSFFLSLLYCGVIMLVHWLLLQILCFVLGPST